MTIFVIDTQAKAIRMAFRVTGRKGLVGDSFQTMRPADKLEGYTFDEIKALGPGEHTLKPKPRIRRR